MTVKKRSLSESNNLSTSKPSTQSSSQSVDPFMDESFSEVRQIAQSFVETAPSFGTAKFILKSLNLPTSTGSVATKKALINHAFANTDNKRAVIDLKSEILGFVLGGEKMVSFFECQPGQREQISSTLEKIVVSNENNPFPCKPTNSELDVFGTDSRLIWTKNNRQKSVFVFATVRTYQAVEHGMLAQLSSKLRKSVKDEISNVEDIYAVMHRTHMFYDICVIPKNGNYIELHMDVGGGVQSQTLIKAQASLERELGELTGYRAVFRTHVNVFPLIDQIYLDDSEGVVTELNFKCSTGGVRYEKLRGPERDDLRSEDYHAAGTGAIDNEIVPYRIAVSWSITVPKFGKSHPELLLPGSHRMLKSSNQFLGTFRILNAFCQHDHRHVIRRLRAALEKAS